MRLITGYLCLLCFVGLLAKAMTRKLHLKKADAVFMNLHKYISTAILVVCVIHIILVFPVLKARSIVFMLTGALTVVTMLLLIVLCHTITQNKRLNLRIHRILTVVMLFSMIGHVWVYFAA